MFEVGMLEIDKIFIFSEFLYSATIQDIFELPMSKPALIIWISYKSFFYISKINVKKNF